MDEEKKKVIKRTVSQKVINAIFRGDDYKTFGKSLWEGQILPMCGDILEDLVCRCIHAVFYDDDNFDISSSRRSTRRDRRDYRGVSTSKHKKKSLRERSRRDIEEDDIPNNLNARETHLVPFKTRTEAEEMIRWMADCCDREGEVSTKDFYVEKNIASSNFNNSRWGWTNPRDIRKARIEKSGGRYYIHFPKPEYLDDDYDEDEDDD